VRIREAAFALRVVRRRAGDAAILYRRSLNKKQEERLTKVASIGPLAFSSGSGLLRAALRATAGPGATLSTGPFHPLDPDWGARVACYALVASGLRSSSGLHKAAENLKHADPTEAAWWFGLMAKADGRRARRALRILLEAAK
jgi:hypothetical protein